VKLLATVLTIGALGALAMPASAADSSSGACRGFVWYGECWTPSEGAAFAKALRQHGVSPAVFKRNHPELAATFRGVWPPRPSTWESCANGYACAKAVVRHYFGAGWRYALAIVGCETGHTYSKYVRGSAGEVSWWQLHPVHFGWIDEARAVADPRYATRMAIRLGAGRDWSPWTCARYV
jgi:hypothetical protein